MGAFKPMVKMETSEPSVTLKLKKGGSATFARMKSEGAKEGFQPVKKMEGGVMGALSRTPAPTTALANPVAARAMAAKRPVRAASLPARSVMPPGKPAARPMMPAMKKGGSMDVAAKLEKHADMPASKAHKGLKTGGVVKGQGGFKTGGVVKGQCGYKDGGSVNDSGHAVAMPKKAPSKPVATSGFTGTFKKGGKVC